MEIIKDYIDKNYTEKTNRIIKYIVIHYTAGVTSKKGASKGTRDWFNNSNAKASAHYIVDDAQIVQAVDDSNIAWHCGANVYIHPECRNNNSIGIEICSNHDSFKGYSLTPPTDPGWYITPLSRNNAALLTAQLMIKYNIPISHVIRHFDCTGKDCPSPWVDSNKEGEKGWIIFLNLVQKEVDKEMHQDENLNSKKYEKISDCPEWSQPIIEWYVNNGYLKGNGDNLDLSYDMIRLLVIIYRMRGD